MLMSEQGQKIETQILADIEEHGLHIAFIETDE